MVVIVVHLVARQHEAMQSQFVDKHLFGLCALLPHVAIVCHFVVRTRFLARFDLSFNEQIGALRVNPELTVLQNHLLEHSLRQWLSEIDFPESEGIVQRHLVLQESMFVLVAVFLLQVRRGSNYLARRVRVRECRDCIQFLCQR